MYILETWQNKRRELTRRGSLQWLLIRVLGSGSTLTSVIKVKSQCHNSQKQVILKNGQIFHKMKNFHKMIKSRPVSWKKQLWFSFMQSSVNFKLSIPCWGQESWPVSIIHKVMVRHYRFVILRFTSVVSFPIQTEQKYKSFSFII